MTESQQSLIDWLLAHGDDKGNWLFIKWLRLYVALYEKQTTLDKDVPHI